MSRKGNQTVERREGGAVTLDKSLNPRQDAPSAMPNVVLDANALMMPFQFGLNLSAEIERLLGRCEIFVPSSVRSELMKLSSKDRTAKAALKLCGRFAEVATRSVGDDGVVEAALTLDAVVVTNDSDLLQALKEKRIRRIRLRSRSHLVIDGE